MRRIELSPARVVAINKASVRISIARCDHGSWTWGISHSVVAKALRHRTECFSELHEA